MNPYTAAAMREPRCSLADVDKPGSVDDKVK